MINESIENEVAQVEEVTPEEVAPVQEESSEVINMRAMRELKNKAEQERDEFARRLQAYEHPAEPVYEDDSNDFDIQEDDLVEGKHLKQVTKKMKKLEKQVQEYQHNANTVTAESRLRSNYPDFDSVVTKENIELLKVSYPELANTLNSGTNLYSTGSSVYTIIKKMGIYKPDPYKADRELAKKNASSPRSSASVAPQDGKSPLTKASAYSTGLTDEMKRTIYKNALKFSENY